MLNSAGMDAQFERSCCAISRGILRKTALDDVWTELKRISTEAQPSDELVNDITLITKMLNDMKGE